MCLLWNIICGSGGACALWVYVCDNRFVIISFLKHMSEKSLPATMDQTYIHKMQYMSLNGSAATSTTDESPYGRIMGKNEPGYVQKQRSMGAIESFAVEGTVPVPQKPTATDYKIYERNNIIAASKFATPKQVESIASQQQQPSQQQQVKSAAPGYNGADIYVQCAKPQMRGPPSPTQSLSGSSQHSNSPRASIVAASFGEYAVLKNQPVYENIDYYGNRNVPAYYHQIPARNPVETGSYESSFRKAQPQVPAGNKMSTNKDVESSPVYENLQELSHKSGGAQPGPQVAMPVHTGAQPPPPYSTKTPFQSPYQQNAVQHLSQSPTRSHYTIMQSKAASPATKPYYHTSPAHQAAPPMSPSSRTFTQQQLEEINPCANLFLS